MPAKWMALLPFVLDALYIASEPKGGWEQYHKKEQDFGRKMKEWVLLPSPPPFKL
jgi:hypothetical protein